MRRRFPADGAAGQRAPPIRVLTLTVDDPPFAAMRRPGQGFIEDFRRATLEGEALEAIADDVAGFAAAVADAPEALSAAMADAADSAGGAASVPSAAFASAACTTSGRVVASDPAFSALHLPDDALTDLVRRVSAERATLSAIANDADGRPVALAIASPAAALRWPLDRRVREALTTGMAACAVLGIGAGDPHLFPRILAAWGFSPAEARLASALVETGDLRRAATRAGVGYQTARETLAAAMAKTGAPRQPEFVRQLTMLAFGDLPSSEATWPTFADAFGLTERQARLAQLVARGSTRGVAATALRTSEHTAKADLKVVYERCGVESAAALGRLVAETDALSRLAAATDVEIVGPGGHREPLRFVRRRRAQGQIAVEDHGPAAGVPVIVFHTPLNGRRLPGVLVAAMTARNLRPISVERPGFGLTSASPTESDFVDEASADLIDVLDALGLERIRILGRSAIMPLRFVGAHPERFESGVLLSAAPPGYRPRRGLLGAGASLLLDQPQLIDGFAKMMARLSSESSIERLTERSVADSPADLVAFADPDNRRDWMRASRQSSAGNGFSREIALHADGGALPPRVTDLPWAVVFGEHDPLGEGGEAGRAAWNATFPRRAGDRHPRRRAAHSHEPPRHRR